RKASHVHSPVHTIPRAANASGPAFRASRSSIRHRCRLQLRPMDSQISIAFIGGGNMATALAAGLAGRTCPAGNLHAIDPSPDVQEGWRARGATASATPDATLQRCNVWIYAVKPQQLRDAVAATRPWLQPGTLVISVAAGIRADTLAGWLGEP